MSHSRPYRRTLRTYRAESRSGTWFLARSPNLHMVRRMAQIEFGYGQTREVRRATEGEVERYLGEGREIEEVKL